VTIQPGRLAGALGLALLASQAYAQAQPKAPAPAATWTYGTHPLWGLSAHVVAGDHAVGLRCLTPKGEGPVIAVAYTTGLATPGATSISYKFVGSPGMGGYRVERKADYVEGAGSACGISLEDFQKAKTLVLEDGGGKPKVLGRIPLAGAKAAIAKLIAACPPLRRDLENCGF
jgi:hypothetical protein